MFVTVILGIQNYSFMHLLKSKLSLRMTRANICLTQTDCILNEMTQTPSVQVVVLRLSFLGLLLHSTVITAAACS